MGHRVHVWILCTWQGAFASLPSHFSLAFSGVKKVYFEICTQAFGRYSRIAAVGHIAFEGMIIYSSSFVLVFRSDFSSLINR